MREDLVYYDKQFTVDTNYSCTEFSAAQKVYGTPLKFACVSALPHPISYYKKSSITINVFADTTTANADSSDSTALWASFDDTCLNTFIAGHYNKNSIPSQCFAKVSAGATLGKYAYLGSHVLYYGGFNDSLKLGYSYDTSYSSKGTVSLEKLPVLYNVPTPALTVNSKLKAECQDPNDPTQYVTDSSIIPYPYIDPPFVMMSQFSGGCHVGEGYRITIK